LRILFAADLTNMALGKSAAAAAAGRFT